MFKVKCLVFSNSLLCMYVSHCLILSISFTVCYSVTLNFFFSPLRHLL